MHETPGNSSPANATPVRVLEIEPLVLSISDTQVRLGGLSERHVFRMLEAGELESIYIGRRRMVLMESIHAYVERQRRAA